MIYTFGSGHVCPQCELSLRNCYVELPDREAMVALFGVKWSHEYATEEDAGVERWELVRVWPNDQCACGGYGREPWLAQLDEARVMAKTEVAGTHLEEAPLEELAGFLQSGLPSKGERDAARAVLATPGLVDKLAAALHHAGADDDVDRVRAIIQRTCEESAR